MNVEEALRRVAGKEQLLYLLLSKMAQDKSPYELKTLYDNNQIEEMFELSHKLKGAFGNLSLTVLFDSISKIVEVTRYGKKDGLEEYMIEFLKEFDRFRQIMDQAV